MVLREKNSDGAPDHLYGGDPDVFPDAYCAGGTLPGRKSAIRSHYKGFGTEIRIGQASAYPVF